MIPLSQSALSISQLGNSKLLEAAGLFRQDSTSNLLDGMVALQQGKLSTGIAAKLAQVQQEVDDSVLDILA